MIFKKSFVLLAALLFVSNSFADTIFDLKSEISSVKSENPIFSTWNAKGPELMNPGIKINFWGRGTGCDALAINGPTTDNINDGFYQALKLTSIDLDHQSLRWMPTKDAKCQSLNNAASGPSFVHINKSQGIGLYTNTGNDDTESFFRQFDENGQNGFGANKYILGTFVAFRFDWTHRESPFVIQAKNSIANSIRIESVQSIATIGVAHNGKKIVAPNQVKQQFAVSFINSECMHAKIPNTICQMKYLFHTAILRDGVVNWNNEHWFDRSALLFDPAQGKIPVFNGPIRAANTDTFAKDQPNLSLWTSYGSSTLHGSFAPTKFIISLTSEQFINALKVVASRVQHLPENELSESDMKTVFGEQWDHLEAWKLLDVNFGQEVHNTDMKNESWIGGGIKEFKIESE